MAEPTIQDMIANFNAKFDELEEKIGELQDKIERMETDVEEMRNGDE